jgi:hypothetical protein
MTSSNHAPAPNRRPRFPLGAMLYFEYPVCAPSSSPAAVGEARRLFDSRIMSPAQAEVFVLLVCCVMGLNSRASDLGSPRQEVRDAAAKAMREKGGFPPRTKWESLVATISPGDSKANVLKQLSRFRVEPANPGAPKGTNTEYAAVYRLDDRWVVTCFYRNQDDVLTARMLHERWRVFDVHPPTGFTGVWVTYYANGQKSEEGRYKEGELLETIGYDGDGKKSDTLSFGVSGDVLTSYAPSGRLMSQFFSGKGQSQVMIEYNGDGSTNYVYCASNRVSYMFNKTNGQIDAEIHYSDNRTTTNFIPKRGESSAPSK